MTLRFETFAFLPPLSAGQVRLHTDELIEKGCKLLMEYAENPGYEDIYWKLWPLPEKRTSASASGTSWIYAQVEDCARRHPYAHIRISGYCPKTGICVRSFTARVPTAQ